MKYCVHCGKECLDDALICPACGCSVQYGNKEQNAGERPNVPPVGFIEDKYSAMSILGFVFAFISSFIGLILSVVAYNEAKNTGSEKSKGLSKAGIIVSAVMTGLGVLLGIIVTVLVFTAIVSIPYLGV